MGINENEFNGKNIVKADNNSASFGTKKTSKSFSINKFLESLGSHSKQEKTDENLIQENQLEDDLPETLTDNNDFKNNNQTIEINDNKTRGITSFENSESELADESVQKIDLKTLNAINKFANKVWHLKGNTGSGILKNIDNGLSHDETQNLANDSFSSNPPLNEDEEDDNLEDIENLSQPVNKGDSEDIVASDDELDEFSAYLQSIENLENETENNEINENSEDIAENAEIDNNDYRTDFEAEDDLYGDIDSEDITSTETSTAPVVLEEENKQPISDDAEQKDGESEEKPKSGRAISKLDYFKYRFLSNSAVGAEGKAKVEELATKYGNRRQDNAGLISTSQSEDVQVHYSGEFKQDDINLDFSKKGNAKIYKNSKVLSITCSIFAVIYAIVGLVMFLVIGRVTQTPVVATSIEMNYNNILYQEIGTKLDLTGLKIITNYSDKSSTETQILYSMLSLPSIINNQYYITGETSTEPSIILVKLNGFETTFKIWGYSWGKDDVVVKYFKTSNIIDTSSYSNILCFAEWSKNLGGHTISFKQEIVLNANNCEFDGSKERLTRVYLDKLNEWVVPILVL